MKKLLPFLIFGCIIFNLCSCGTTSTLALSGNSIVIENTKDRSRITLTKEEDINIIQQAFSIEYKEINKPFDESNADMILWFGNNLNSDLNSEEESIEIIIIDNKAYIQLDEKMYCSSEINLDTLPLK